MQDQNTIHPLSSKNLIDLLSKENKFKYLEPYQLWARDLPSITAYYQAIYPSIKFVINGETEAAKKIIEEKKEDKRKELEPAISLLQNDQKKYAFYIQEHFTTGERSNEFYISNMWGSAFKSYYNEIVNKIPREILAKNNYGEYYFKEKTLQENLLLEINNNCQSLSSQCQELLNNSIEKYIKYLKNIIDNISLDKKEAMQEVKAIQASLNATEIIAYIFTNGQKYDRRHFEVLIILNRQIIKPISWNTDYREMINPENLEGLFHLDLSNFVQVTRLIYNSELKEVTCRRLISSSDPGFPFAQSNDLECGTLGLLYLKELLKDRAKQLKQFTLSFIYYTNNKIHYFFFPSPHVLRYSQSGRYNKILTLILEDGDITEFEQDGKNISEKLNYKVFTLKKILVNSISIAESKGDTVIVENNREILNILPSFRQKWLEEYKKSMVKRAEMTGEPYNIYLSFKTKHHELIANRFSLLENRQYELKIKESQQQTILIQDKSSQNEYINMESNNVSDNGLSAIIEENTLFKLNNRINNENSENLTTQREDKVQREKNQNKIASEDLKAKYLKDESLGSYQLWARDYPSIIAYYQEKYPSLNFIINGQTRGAQAYLQKKQRLLEQKIEPFKDDSKKYVSYIIANLINGERDDQFFISNSHKSSFVRYYSDIIGIIPSHLLSSDDEGNCEIIDRITEEDIKLINGNYTKLEENCKRLFEKSIKEYIEYLELSLTKVSINGDEVIQEVKNIQDSLKDEEIVGYIFSNGKKEEKYHFEVLVITKDKLIKPVDWNVVDGRIDSICSTPIYQPSICYFFEVKMDDNHVSLWADGITPFPQTQTLECGALGMLYLKELLKDNAKQLKEYTLSFDFYFNCELQHFFFPSPQVLRYSQSSRFNEIIYRMINEESKREFEYEKFNYYKQCNDTYKYSVTTIRKILEDSIKFSQAKGDTETEKQNLDILAQLPSFSDKWLKEYKTSIIKRDSMQGNQHNRYLAYKTGMMEQITKFGSKQEPSMPSKPLAGDNSSSFGEIEDTNINNTKSFIRAEQNASLFEAAKIIKTIIKSKNFRATGENDLLKVINGILRNPAKNVPQDKWRELKTIADTRRNIHQFSLKIFFSSLYRSEFTKQLYNIISNYDPMNTVELCSKLNKLKAKVVQEVKPEVSTSDFYTLSSFKKY